MPLTGPIHILLSRRNLLKGYRFITLTSPCSETVIGSPCHILWAKFWWEHRKQGGEQQIYKSLSFLQKGKKQYKPLFVFSWQNSVLQVKERRSWWAIHHLFSASQKKPIIRESCNCTVADFSRRQEQYD